MTEQSSLEENLPISKTDLKTKLYYSVIDYILQEIKHRFSENNDVLKAISYLHPASEHFASFSRIESLAKHYGSDTEMLKSELKILPTTIKKYELSNNIKISNLLNLLDLLEKYKLVFCETYNLVVIAVTIPVSSATCERTFSCLRRLKTYMRAKMSNARLVYS